MEKIGYGARVEVINNYQNNGIEIWLFEVTPAVMLNLNIDADGMIIKTEMPEVAYYHTGEFKPFLFMPKRLGIPFIQAIVEWNETNGTKTVNQNFTEGKLEATEKHLQDMRTIVTKVLKL